MIKDVYVFVKMKNLVPEWFRRIDRKPEMLCLSSARSPGGMAGTYLSLAVSPHRVSCSSFDRAHNVTVKR